MHTHMRAREHTTHEHAHTHVSTPHTHTCEHTTHTHTHTCKHTDKYSHMHRHTITLITTSLSPVGEEGIVAAFGE